jgi:nucleoside permease NupC
MVSLQPRINPRQVLFAPVAFVIGVPWHDCAAIGNLLGVRMVLNELVAFSMLGPQKAILDPRSFTIATFALCGFANFSSIGIQMGGIGALAPNKKGELAKLGIRAMLAGTMANLMSASIAGMLLTWVISTCNRRKAFPGSASRRLPESSRTLRVDRLAKTNCR